MKNLAETVISEVLQTVNKNLTEIEKQDKKIQEYLEEALYVVKDNDPKDKLKEETFKIIIEDELALSHDPDVQDILNNHRDELFY